MIDDIAASDRFGCTNGTATWHELVINSCVLGCCVAFFFHGSSASI
jgi:hypothetical protein